MPTSKNKSLAHVYFHNIHPMPADDKKLGNTMSLVFRKHCKCINKGL